MPAMCFSGASASTDPTSKGDRGSNTTFSFSFPIFVISSHMDHFLMDHFVCDILVILTSRMSISYLLDLKRFDLVLSAVCLDTCGLSGFAFCVVYQVLA